MNIFNTRERTLCTICQTILTKDKIIWLLNQWNNLCDSTLMNSIAVSSMGGTITVLNNSVYLISDEIFSDDDFYNVYELQFPRINNENHHLYKMHTNARSFITELITNKVVLHAGYTYYLCTKTDLENVLQLYNEFNPNYYHIYPERKQKRILSSMTVLRLCTNLPRELCYIICDYTTDI